MAFATLDDRTGRLEVAVFSEVLEKYREHLVKDILLVVEGNLSFDDYAGQLRLTAENLFTIAEARAHFAKHLFIQWPSAGRSADHPGDQWVNELVDLLMPFRGGSCPIYIEYRGKPRRRRSSSAKAGACIRRRTAARLQNVLERTR